MVAILKKDERFFSIRIYRHYCLLVINSLFYGYCPQNTIFLKVGMRARYSVYHFSLGLLFLVRL